MPSEDKPLVMLHSGVRTPPMGEKARREAGFLLRRLQKGETIEMPHLRPMKTLGPRVCDDSNQ